MEIWSDRSSVKYAKDLTLFVAARRAAMTLGTFWQLQRTLELLLAA